ncbi:MAG: hypothetical protein ACYCQI_07040 [Gammaproteobacteria bacterium]
MLDQELKQVSETEGYLKHKSIPKASKERFFIERKLAADHSKAPKVKENEKYIEEVKKSYPLFDEGLGRSVGEALAGDFKLDGIHQMLGQKPIDYLWGEIAKQQQNLDEKKIEKEATKDALRDISKNSHMLGHVFEAEAKIALKVNDYDGALAFMQLSLHAFEQGEKYLNKYSSSLSEKLEIEAFGISATEPLHHFSSHIRNAKAEIQNIEQLAQGIAPKKR